MKHGSEKTTTKYKSFGRQKSQGSPHRLMQKVSKNSNPGDLSRRCMRENQGERTKWRLRWIEREREGIRNGYREREKVLENEQKTRVASARLLYLRVTVVSDVVNRIRNIEFLKKKNYFFLSAYQIG